MRRRLVSFAAVIFAAGCSDQPISDEPLLGPTLSPMASPTAEVDVLRAPLRASEGDASDVAVGISSIDPGVQMFWDPSKAAFRAGRVTGTQWDYADLGYYSFPTGYNTTASGNYSAALGIYTTASGWTSTAMGEYTTAQAYESVVLGRYNEISGSSEAVEAFLIMGKLALIIGGGCAAVVAGILAIVAGIIHYPTKETFGPGDAEVPSEAHR